MGNLIHILSTKILDEAIIKQAASENILIDCIPYIQIKPINEPGLKEKISQAVEKAKFVIFTSANAVEAVSKQSQGNLPLKIFCISGKTKNAVEDHFPQSRIIEDAPNGAELAKKILNHNIDSAIFFCGNKRLDTIPKTFSENKISLEEIVVYETVLTPQKIEKDYDGIIFFSPSAVESFISVNRMGKNLPVFSFAGSTLNALQKNSEKIIVSNNPSEQGMLNVVTNYYKRL